MDNLLVRFFQEKRNEFNKDELLCRIKNSDLSVSDFNAYVKGSWIPSVEATAKIFDILNVDKNEFLEYIKDDAALLYKYWEFLHPDYESKAHLSRVILKFMHDKGMSVSAFVSKTNLSQPYFSLLSSGFRTITFQN